MKFFRRFFSQAFSVFLLSAVILISWIIWQVLWGDMSDLRKNTILSRMREETAIFYLDEVHTIGSIFNESHRRYVPIEEMPHHLLEAVIASEDKFFYDHIGINPMAIFAAFWEGLLHGGKFRRGGSSITQQTVKNIMGDWETSFARKFREMIKSLQLERLYNKKQILEFYLNQFHVAGNGYGAGIAARYYFNKDIKEINLIESAFIAGSLKAPGRYNPFIKSTPQGKVKAENLAKQRKNYVIERMFQEKLLSVKEYKKALNENIPFQRGEFRSSEVSLIGLVRSQIEKPEILSALGLKHPDELPIAGFRVYTTLDKTFQEAARFHMRSNLSRLETILSGFEKAPLEEFKPRKEFHLGEFLCGKISKIEDSKTAGIIHLDFQWIQSRIEEEEILTYLTHLDRGKNLGPKSQWLSLKNQLNVGDAIYVQVLSLRPDGTPVLALRRRPHISGGILVLDQGEVRAAVSGFDTSGFNRAMWAAKQPGSSAKAIVYMTGLQLGWSLVDSLDNQRRIFPYQGRFYYPRADHFSPYDKTSLLWSGVMSENLASVYLGSHLVDKLHFEGFRLVMDHLGLLPYPGESPRDFHFRVARATGIAVDRDGIEEHAWYQTIQEVEADLVFSGQDHILNELKRMWWGKSYASEMKKLLKKGPSALPNGMKELNIRLAIASHNFLRFRALGQQMLVDFQRLGKNIQGVEEKFFLGEINHKLCLIYSSFLPDEPHFPKNLEKVRKILPEDLITMRFDPDEVYLEGKIPQKFLRVLEKKRQEFVQKVLEDSSPYRLNHYYNHHDFRIGLGLQYAVQLTKATGTHNKIEPVLSLPLGASDMTLGELAKLYQTFASGHGYRFFKEGPSNQLNYIKRIEDRFGNILYQPQVKIHKILDPKVSDQMLSILRAVVTHGTGRLLDSSLTLTEGDLTVKVPAFGKTGTTNDFRTSTFVGLLPYPTEARKPLDAQKSYAIAAYVGYDNNKSMEKGGIRIYASQGALPLWRDFARSVLKIRNYKSYLDFLDLNILQEKYWPLERKIHSSPLLVDLPTGTILKSAEDLGDEPLGPKEAILSLGISEGHVERVLDLFPKEEKIPELWTPKIEFDDDIQDVTEEGPNHESFLDWKDTEGD